MDQKSIQKGIGKRIQKRNDFSLVLEGFGGGPCRGNPCAEIFRPPKTLKSKVQVQVQVQGQVHVQVQVQVQVRGQLDKITHTRRRAERGGGYMMACRGSPPPARGIVSIQGGWGGAKTAQI